MFSVNVELEKQKGVVLTVAQDKADASLVVSLKEPYGVRTEIPLTVKDINSLIIMLDGCKQQLLKGKK